MVEQRAKELEDFRRMLRPEAEMAFGEVLGMMGANAGAADYLEPATPRRDPAQRVQNRRGAASVTRVHVVCRDCDFETLKTAKTIAVRAASRHEDKNGHETDYEVVAE